MRGPRGENSAVVRCNEHHTPDAQALYPADAAGRLGSLAEAGMFPLTPGVLALPAQGDPSRPFLGFALGKWVYKEL
mgnify:CR=1 FL=1